MEIAELGALIGAIVSFLVADRSRPVVIKTAVGPGEYAMVVPLVPSRVRRVDEIIERHHPRALERAA